MEQLKIDIVKVEKSLENAREAMARTGEEKCLDNTDIVRGMIEGYIFVDHHLLFCTLRAGRMLFWEDQHDVGHTPPKTVWDISGMHILDSTPASRGSSFFSKQASQRI